MSTARGTIHVYAVPDCMAILGPSAIERDRAARSYRYSDPVRTITTASSSHKGPHFRVYRMNRTVYHRHTTCTSPYRAYPPRLKMCRSLIHVNHTW